MLKIYTFMIIVFFIFGCGNRNDQSSFVKNDNQRNDSDDITTKTLITDSVDGTGQTFFLPTQDEMLEFEEARNLRLAGINSSSSNKQDDGRIDITITVQPKIKILCSDMKHKICEGLTTWSDKKIISGGQEISDDVFRQYAFDKCKNEGHNNCEKYLTKRNLEKIGDFSSEEYEKKVKSDWKEEIVKDNWHLKNMPLSFCLDVANGDSNQCIDMYIWNSEQQMYAKTLNVKDLTNHIPTSLGLSLVAPSNLVKNLRETINNKSKRINGDFREPMEFNLKTWIVGTSKESAVNIDKLIIANLPIGITNRKQQAEASFSKGFSNENFGANVSFNGYAKLDNEGAHGGISGNAWFKIFGSKYIFLDALSKADVNPVNLVKTGSLTSVKHMGYYIYGPYDNYGALGFVTEKNKKWRKEKTKSKNFFVSILVIEAKAGASGEIGINSKYGVSKDFFAEAKPFADIGAFVSAALNAFVAKAGVKGNLDLLDDTFSLNGNVGMQLVGDCSTNSNSCKARGYLFTQVKNDLTGPKGSIGPFVEWWEPYYETRWACTKIWSWSICVPYPYIGTTKKEKYWPLVSWGGYKRNDILLKINKYASVGPLY